MKLQLKFTAKLYCVNKQKKGNLDNEITALKVLKHENIVKLYEVFEDDTNIYLVLEYIEGESLLSYMRKKTNRRLSNDLARDIFKQIISALSYCHQNFIAHRDIKLENILVWKQTFDPELGKEPVPKIKIIDFGFAYKYEYGEKGSSFWGTPSFMAPELINKQDYDYELIDVWALGVLLYALLTGLFPFKGASNRDMYWKIVKGSYIIPERVQIGAKRLIMKMLQVIPEHRRYIRNITGKQIKSIFIDKWLFKDNEEEMMAKSKYKKQILIQEHINFNSGSVISNNSMKNKQKKTSFDVSEILGDERITLENMRGGRDIYVPKITGIKKKPSVDVSTAL